MSVDTAPPFQPNVVWVTVDGIKQPKSQWTYVLSEDKPDYPGTGASRDLRIPTDRLCHSYTELIAWLTTYRCETPPPDYFIPTREELAEKAEWILRPVARLR